jgi:ABC-type arginine transport system permease subunit
VLIGSPQAGRALEKKRFPAIAVGYFFSNKDVLPTIWTLLGSDTVGEMHVPAFLPGVLAVRLIFP